MANSNDPRRNPPPKLTLVVGGNPSPADQPPSGNAPEPALNPSIEAALKTWSDELIDTGGRNRLLYYHKLKSFTLDLDGKADADAVAALIDRGRAMLSALFPYQPPDDEDDEDQADEAELLAREQFKDALKRAKSIRRKAREHYEEQGIQTLYLAFGFATWTQVPPGPTPNAPILLSAAELGQRGRLDPDFSLIVSDEWELNPTLLHILRTEFGAKFDEQELDELAQPSEFQALTERLARICEEVPGFEIREGIALSTFSYAKLPMVRDLQQAGAAVAKHPLVAALAGDEKAKDNLRAMYAPGDDDGEFRRPVPPAREFLVLDADGTQSEVINSVRAGNHLVVNGPPGTGKSQTIANLIATLAADGKSVLFVAEKRAAIDAVTKRLDKVGLGDLVFDLHAGTRSRRQIAQQLADALAASRVAQPADTVENERALVRSRDRLTNVNEALHQRVPPWDVTAYELQGRLLGVEEADRTDLRILKGTLDKLAGEEVATAREALRDCVARQLGMASDGPWRKALEEETLKDIGEADDALDAIGDLLGTELPNLQRESSALAVATDQPHPGTLTEAEDLARNARDSAAAAIERQTAAYDRERAAERAVPETTDALREAEEESRLSADELAETKTEHLEAGRSRSTAAKPFTGEVASAQTSELARIAQQTALLRGGSLGRLSASLFKRGRYRAAQRTLAALFAAGPPPDLREALGLLDALISASRDSDGSRKRLDAAEKAAAKASEALDLAQSEHRAAERELADAATERETAVADCERWTQIDHEPLAKAASAVRAPLRIAARHAAISEPGGMDLAALERDLRDLERDGDNAHAIAALQQARLKLQQIGIAQFADAASTAGWDPDKAVRVFNHAWLNSVYRAVRRGREEIAGFDAEQHEASWAEFRKSDAAHIASGAQRIKRQWAEGVIRVRNSHGQQQQTILHEAAKKSRHLPMRELFRRAPDVLTALKPCWAMSPLVVAQLLPASPPPFDVVIFDEASQIPPADAICSLLRGRQAVVAGDEKQLPPTTFFTQSSADEEEREDDEELLTDDVESILKAMSSLLISPRSSKSLGWHYRSEDERLIAFANHHVYDGRMTTFPSALADDCISHVYVQSSPRTVQQHGSNSAEVERVVDLILEHARTQPGETLGVIAFGEQHARRIEETLEQERRKYPDLEEFFSESGDEPFFVKNLERVQGDERAAIILSVGYGRGTDGRIVYRFGPINQEGGHRRLNVAITRAKRRMTIVSTFGPNDLDRSRIRADGARLLCDYIAYAASGGADLGRVDVDKEPPNYFERDIQQRLEAADVPIKSQYGASGYRIDFAAFHPEQPGRPVLAIEADGASYHSSKSARDSDRLRQEHLERLGWRFHRIWSTEYFRNPEREIERTVDAWRSAVAAADAEPEPPSEPAEAEAPAPPEPPPPQPQRGPKPNLGPKRPITEYALHQLQIMINWVNSDGVLRTEEEIIQEVSIALGFQRRGTRITAAIRNALRRLPKPPSRTDL